MIIAQYLDQYRINAPTLEALASAIAQSRNPGPIHIMRGHNEITPFDRGELYFYLQQLGMTLDEIAICASPKLRPYALSTVSNFIAVSQAGPVLRAAYEDGLMTFATCIYTHRAVARVYRSRLLPIATLDAALNMEAVIVTAMMFSAKNDPDATLIKLNDVDAAVDELLKPYISQQQKKAA